MCALEAVVEGLGGVPEFDEGQTVDDEGEGSDDDNQRQQEVPVGQERADNANNPHSKRQGVEAVDGLSLVVAEMTQETVVYVTLVGSSETSSQ